MIENFINREYLDKSTINDLSIKYANAKPFPHIEIENFFKNDLVEDIKSDFPNENRSFIVDCKTDVSANVDSQLFREAISNLLDNGIKYGKPNSEIKITCEQNQDNIKIHLSNEGDLIPVEHKEKIFQRFYRIEKSRSREKGGTGLGLSIVKHIIIIHNGTIDVEDYKDKGTVFILNLPT